MYFLPIRSESFPYIIIQYEKDNGDRNQEKEKKREKEKEQEREKEKENFEE